MCASSLSRIASRGRHWIEGDSSHSLFDIILIALNILLSLGILGTSACIARFMYISVNPMENYDTCKLAFSDVYSIAHPTTAFVTAIGNISQYYKSAATLARLADSSNLADSAMRALSYSDGSNIVDKIFLFQNSSFLMSPSTFLP